MICSHHNRVIVRKKDSAPREIIRCADPTMPCFTKEVTEEQCSQCPRHLEAAELAARLEAAKCKAADSGATQVPQTPSFFRRSVTYAEAVTGWIAAGHPERSEEETKRIFEEHCSKCAWYDRNKQICRGCGCKVTNVGHAIFNKIKMATQHCPRSLW